MAPPAAPRPGSPVGENSRGGGRVLPEGVQQHQQDSDGDGAVGDVEHPGKDAQGADIDEVDHGAEAHPIEQTGARLRAMMPWIGANKLVDQDKN